LDDIAGGAPEGVRRLLRFCLDALPADFDLRRASIGNLVLAGAWLEQGRSLVRATHVFSKLVGPRGTVRPVSEDDIHLAAELADGSVVVGQHRITDPSGAERRARIERVYLVRSLGDPTPTRTTPPAEVLDLIGRADLICFPVGSFFTSVLAALLPDGIADAIAASGAPKVYVPNPGGDPEERGMSLVDRVRALRSHLLAGLAASRERGDASSPGVVLDTVLVDDDAAGANKTEIRAVEDTGIRTVRAPLRAREDRSRYDGAALANALLALLPR
jgi:CofD-related protein of GAK system